jgi:hypothetical protein
MDEVPGDGAVPGGCARCPHGKCRVHDTCPECAGLEAEAARAVIASRAGRTREAVRTALDRVDAARGGFRELLGPLGDELTAECGGQDAVYALGQARAWLQHAELVIQNRELNVRVRELEGGTW